MKNKLLLSLGSSLLVFAPVMTVVACGEDKPAAESQDKKDVTTAKASVITAFGAANSAWTSTMTVEEWTAVQPVTTYATLDAAVISSLEVTGKTIPTLPSGVALTYTLTKNTPATTITLTVRVAKGTESETVVYTIAKPVAITAESEIAKVTTLALGQLTLAGAVPTSAEITTAIKAANTTIDSATTFEIQGTATETGATVKAKVGSTLSTTTKAVTYTKATATITAEGEIAKVTSLALGQLTLAGDVPTNAEITTAIKAANTTIDSATTFEIQGAATATGATVKAKVGSTLSTTTKAVTYTKATTSLSNQQKADADRDQLNAFNATTQKTAFEHETYHTYEEPAPDAAPDTPVVVLFEAFTQQIATALGFGTIPTLTHGSTIEYSFEAIETPTVPATAVKVASKLVFKVTQIDASSVTEDKTITSSTNLQDYIVTTVVELINESIPMLTLVPIELPEDTIETDIDEEMILAALELHPLFGEFIEELTLQNFTFTITDLNKTSSTFKLEIGHAVVTPALKTETLNYSIAVDPQVKLENEIARLEEIDALEFPVGTDFVDEAVIDMTDTTGIYDAIATIFAFEESLVSPFMYSVTVSVVDGVITLTIEVSMLVMGETPSTITGTTGPIAVTVAAPADPAPLK